MILHRALRIFILAISMLWYLTLSLNAQNKDSLLPFDEELNGELSSKEQRELLKRLHASDVFFSRMEKRADSGTISKHIYPLIFKKSHSPAELEIDHLPANAIFKRYNGDIIRSIRITKVPVLGSSIYDTSHTDNSKIIKTLNELHFYTRDDVIKKYLQFKVGQKLDAVKLSDNERFIHNLPIFEDARFVVVPVNKDSVDLILIIKDIYPLGADLKVNAINNGTLRIYNRNALGFGHQLSQSFVYNENLKPSFFLGEGGYIIRNIKSSFTDFRLFWAKIPNNRLIGIELSKPFFTPEIKYAGGLNVTYQEAWLFDYNLDDRFRFSRRIFETWIGYSVITNRLKSISSRRQQAAITFGIYQLDYYKAPTISLFTIPSQISFTRVLTGINILRSEFYRTNMLYGYGRTEDIPYGHHAELVLGWENTELNKRFYSALKLDITQSFKYAGILRLDIQIGGYINDGNYEDGVFKTNFNLISPLLRLGKSRIRNFGLISYTKGINRKQPGSISINDGEIGPLFNNFDLSGYQRLRGRIESVIFTPYHLLGFRFAAFWYMEAAVIASKNENFVSQDIYSAFGAGIRFRNENLIFSTFQLAFAWYPVTPLDQSNFNFIFSDLPEIRRDETLIEKPNIVEFR